jgi:MoxR-like ATPase
LKEVKELHSIPSRILEEVSKVIIGKQENKRLLIVALLSEGHLLIEGYPGTAKTLIAKTFARAIAGQFKRIQFTPDMLPADVTGFNVYSPDGNSRFVAGPLFANVVLADELNRTTPRTQAALIEAMQEEQVTIEGVTHPLADVFMIIASQVPFGSEGTYPLTDVQADRFMFRVWSDYLGKDDEKKAIFKADYIEEPDIRSVVSLNDIIELQEAVKQVHVSEEVGDYIVSLVHTIRNDPDVISGPSTRAGVALFKGSRAYAFLEGRDFVIPDDVKSLAFPALIHRVHIKPEAEMDNVTPQKIIERALNTVPVPKI